MANITKTKKHKKYIVTARCECTATSPEDAEELVRKSICGTGVAVFAVPITSSSDEFPWKHESECSMRDMDHLKMWVWLTTDDTWSWKYEIVLSSGYVVVRNSIENLYTRFEAIATMENIATKDFLMMFSPVRHAIKTTKTNESKKHVTFRRAKA
jgi:hypothetical protein